VFLKSSTLGALRFFEAAARHLSFKKAGLELHVTPGAVSQQVKQLEKALRCNLFHRLPRQISLTSEGARFALVVRGALLQLEEEAQALIAMSSPQQIRLRAGPSFALRWLVPRLGRFYARHPHVKLFVTAAYGEVDPTRREFDLAIELGRGNWPGLHSELLMDEYLTPVASPNYLKEHPLKRPSDLAACTLLHDAHAWVAAEKDAEWRHWLDESNTRGVDSTQGQFFTLANLSLEAALAHQGVAMGRAALIRELVADGRLIAPVKLRVKSPTPYCLVYPREVADGPALQAVMQWLREEIGCP
jgi:LysR family glycine cleavage system transcriptional activator